MDNASGKDDFSKDANQQAEPSHPGLPSDIELPADQGDRDRLDPVDDRWWSEETTAERSSTNTRKTTTDAETVEAPSAEQASLPLLTPFISPKTPVEPPVSPPDSPSSVESPVSGRLIEAGPAEPDLTGPLVVPPLKRSSLLPPASGPEEGEEPASEESALPAKVAAEEAEEKLPPPALPPLPSVESAEARVSDSSDDAEKSSSEDGASASGTSAAMLPVPPPLPLVGGQPGQTSVSLASSEESVPMPPPLPPAEAEAKSANAVEAGAPSPSLLDAEEASKPVANEGDEAVSANISAEKPNVENPSDRDEATDEDAVSSTPEDPTESTSIAENAPVVLTDLPSVEGKANSAEGIAGPPPLPPLPSSVPSPSLSDSEQEEAKGAEDSPLEQAPVEELATVAEESAKVELTDLPASVGADDVDRAQEGDDAPLTATEATEPVDEETEPTSADDEASNAVAEKITEEEDASAVVGDREHGESTEAASVSSGPPPLQPEANTLEKSDDAVHSDSPPASEEPGTSLAGATPAAATITAGEGVPSTVVENTAPRKGCWGLFTTLFFFAGLLVIAALIGGAFYARHQVAQMEGTLLDWGREKLEAQGLFVDYESHEFKLPRGIILQNVKVYSEVERENQLLGLSNLGVLVDPVQWIKERDIIDRVEVSLDEAEVAVFHQNQPVETLEGVSAEIQWTSDKVLVERFSTFYSGIFVSAYGEMPRGKAQLADGDPAPAAAESPATTTPVESSLSFASIGQALSGIVQFKDKLRLETLAGNAPSLHVELISIEPTEEGGGAFYFSGTLTGREVVWNTLTLDAITAKLDYDPTARTLDVPSLYLGYQNASLAASLTYFTDEASGERQCLVDKFTSSINFLDFLKAYEVSWVERVTLVDAPLLKGSATIMVEKPESSSFSIDYAHAGGFHYQSEARQLTVSNIMGKITSEGELIQSQGLRADVFGGRLEILNSQLLKREDEWVLVATSQAAGLSLEQFESFWGGTPSGLNGSMDARIRCRWQSTESQLLSQGDFTIHDANLTRFPVVGRVRGLLGEVIPAFARKEAGTLTGSYNLEQGLILIPDLVYSDMNHRMGANVQMKIADRDTVVRAEARLEEPLASALGLQGQVIESRANGSLHDLSITLSAFPTAFLAENLRPVLGTTPSSLEHLGRLLQETENPGDILSEGAQNREGFELGPEVNEFLKGILGPKPEEGSEGAPALRAIPQAVEQ